ncbi:MAG: 50S ribosomal protein L22 [Acidilobaceae archaeon]|nr:50S ribosomal protein L22 [Acidilobaceae archaeon]MCX8166048.1 50S ribosomal protein L22 [Acidilobaceae archaeon]MDW7974691.1 50S ribosomal protein L22 [Sulfolobales archaeon]
MPEWSYSVQFADESKIAKAMRWDVRVHPKVMREVCAVIKGMKVSEAKEFLERVIRKEEAVPFRRAHGKVPHRRGLADKWGWPVGRYPVKAARELLKVLVNAENNAEVKGLELERLKVIHASAHKGMTMKRYMPRAFGRATPSFKVTSHVEVVVAEV